MGREERKSRDRGASSAALGDITKEALTPSCDVAKQTPGPWRAWENSIITQE